MIKAVITVIGKDKPGIIAEVSTKLAKYNINILDVSQTIMENLFTMMMMTDIDKSTLNFEELKESFDQLSKDLGVKIQIQRAEIFNVMDRV